MRKGEILEMESNNITLGKTIKEINNLEIQGEKGKKLTTEIKPKNIKINTVKELTEINKKYNKLYKENINVISDNYYLSDVITKASITMAKCSALNKTKQNNFK
jgi:hypothetical protein